MDFRSPKHFETKECQIKPNRFLPINKSVPFSVVYKKTANKTSFPPLIANARNAENPSHTMPSSRSQVHVLFLQNKNQNAIASPKDPFPSVKNRPIKLLRNMCTP
jgi:hypothetical protein